MRTAFNDMIAKLESVRKNNIISKSDFVSIHFFYGAHGSNRFRPGSGNKCSVAAAMRMDVRLCL